MPWAYPEDPFSDGYVPIQECAARMGVSVKDIKRLVTMRALRAKTVWGEVFVEPAVVIGGWLEDRTCST